MNYRKLFILPLIAIAAILPSCGDDEPEQPGEGTGTENPGGTTEVTNTMTYIFSRSTVWSSQAYSDVTLSEIHTQVSDFELEAESKPGYTLKLVRQSDKDSHGFYVYRITVAMTALSQTTTSNESDVEEFQCTLNGKFNNGKPTSTSNIEVSLQRFYQPVPEAEALDKDWYLASCGYTDNTDWCVWSGSKNTYVLSEESTGKAEFTPESSPIKCVDSPHGRVWSVTGSVPGWPTGFSFHGGDILTDGRLGTNADAPAVYLITDKKLYVITTEKDAFGNLLKTYRYNFTLPE